MTNYAEFLSAKRLIVPPEGFEVDPDQVTGAAFPFQADIIQWITRRGRAAVFADCGLGKGIIALEWARLVAAHTGGAVLILAPLAVAQQFVREGAKFGIVVNLCRSGADVRKGINVTNYDRLHLFDPAMFDGVVCDEASILKSYDGATRTRIIESFARTPYRLACTATPAPNDHMELGNQAEFLGVMSRVEMLATFFTHDGGDTSKWRLKGHAEADFWRWVCSWAVMLRKPSDLGYQDGGFVLPPLTIHEVAVESSHAPQGMLFSVEAQTLIDQRAARRASLADRVAAFVRIVNEQTIRYNLKYEHTTGIATARIQPKMASGSQGATECTGSGTSSQSDAGTEGSAEGVHARLSTAQPGQMEADTRAAGPSQREEKGAIRQRSGDSRILPEELKAVDREESRQTEIATVENAWDSTERLSGFAGRTERALCDLRALGHDKPEYFPASRSRTQDREGSGVALHQLQSRAGQVPGQPRSVDVGSSVPALPKWIAWVGLNDEQHALEQALKEAGISYVSVEGTTPEDARIAYEREWREGKTQVMITKASVFGFGMNWQHCHNVAFVGLSHSFEAYYQAIRRCWRFGQIEPVTCHVITSTAEGAVVANIRRKEADAERMAAEMVGYTQETMTANLQALHRETVTYKRDVATGKNWTLHLGDSVDVCAEMAAESVHYIIYSPPFASLYTYSNSERDMGNVRDHDEFFAHFDFLVADLFRVLKPGRLLSFHCMNIAAMKSRDGYIGIHDFRGDLIRQCQRQGFIYHSEVCIWKDPVTAMQRTKALGLLHKQIKKDSTMSRQGIPDYLVTMRKPGANLEPVTHTDESFPVSLWQRYASPIWMDINQSNTLQRESAREDKDERHIAPLQLEVIERAIDLWTNHGDLVLSPFAGIGSEGYVALGRGRRFLGVELKESYYKLACANLREAEHNAERPDLFTAAGIDVEVSA